MVVVGVAIDVVLGITGCHFVIVVVDWNEEGATFVGEWMLGVRHVMVLMMAKTRVAVCCDK